MPSNEQQLRNKAQKTAQLLGVANLMLSPLYFVDLRIAIVTNAAALYYLHELGKSRRLGSNLLHQAHTFFSSQTHARSLGLNNAFRNLINGGAAVYDKVSVEMLAFEEAERDRETSSRLR